jgi:hypothetical protein
VVENYVLVAQLFFTTRFIQGPSSSSHMFLIAQCMESDVSDDETDATSLDDLVELKECLRN